MDKTASQSRLSRTQLPTSETGNAALSLDQLTDLDQAISLSRGGRPEAPVRPTPVTTRSIPTAKTPTAKPSLSKAATVKPPLAETPLPKPSIPEASAPKEPAPTPVRSAKDAINAMYSRDNPARLSDYLGPSAKEIINAAAYGSSEGRDIKSASSLHHASSQRKLEATRPSASAIFRAAKSEKSTPVVHTSLKLAPKSPRLAKPASPALAQNPSPTQPAVKPSPIIINSRSRAMSPRPASAPKPPLSVRPKKGQIKITTPSPTAIAVSTIEEAASLATGASAKSAPRYAAKSAVKTVVSPRPAKPAPKSAPKPSAEPMSKPASSRSSGSPFASAAPSSRSISVDGFARPSSAKKQVAKPAADPYQKLPADSVKRRFRLAPKGFSAAKPEQARPARRKFMSFSNPDYTVPVPKPSPAVDIYGMTEPEPEPEKDGLGVVEDYRPANPTNPAMGTSASNNAANDASASSPAKKTAPDNNRYALGGQSPFFLKSVSVEKRPLSDAPTRRADTISPIYTDPGDEVPRKNIYDGKSSPKSPKSSAKKPDPRDLPQRPTVIIPSNRRSHTPLFLLLILTVILGAAVGAAVYFFFFQ